MTSRTLSNLAFVGAGMVLFPGLRWLVGAEDELQGRLLLRRPLLAADGLHHHHELYPQMCQALVVKLAPELERISLADRREQATI